MVESITGKSKLAVSSCCAQFLRYTTLTLANIESEVRIRKKSSMYDILLESGYKTSFNELID